MTKTELEIRNKELEEILKEQENFQEIKKRNDQLVQEVYDKNKAIKSLEQTLQNKEQLLSKLNQSYNDLAALFDEYIRTFEDGIEIQKLFLRNNLRNQELINAKIKNFNGSKEGGTE